MPGGKSASRHVNHDAGDHEHRSQAAENDADLYPERPADLL